MKFRVVITEVTNFGPLYCVAGWDLDQHIMIRPEPAPASFWDSRFVGANLAFWPGRIVTFEGHRPPNQPYPHATEDVVVDSRTLAGIGATPLAALPVQISGSLSQNLDQIFQGSMHANMASAYVIQGANCPSLGAIELNRNDIKFGEKTDNNGNKKLRCLVPYQQRAMNFGVTSDQLRTAWKSGGIPAVDALLAGPRVHLRIGLARVMAGGNQCYVQINGIYTST
jgi:hypothetical protein